MSALSSCLLVLITLLSATESRARAAPSDSPPPEAGESEETEPVVVPPKALEVPRAEYPPEALEAGIEAQVTFLLDLDAEVQACVLKLDDDDQRLTEARLRQLHGQDPRAQRQCLQGLLLGTESQKTAPKP